MNNTIKKCWVLTSKNDCYWITWSEDNDEDEGFAWGDEEDDEAILKFATKAEAEKYLKQNRCKFPECESGEPKVVSWDGEWNRSDLTPFETVVAPSAEAPEISAKGILGGLKQIAADGVQLGLGLQIAGVIRNHTTDALRKAKFPEATLMHPITQSAILVGAPVLLHVVLPMVPKVKVPATVRGFIEAAATAAVAKVTEDLSGAVTGFLKPLFRDISAIARMIRS